MRDRGNLRRPPAYVTPNLVKRVLEKIGKPHIVLPAPVEPVPVRGDPPVLRVVEKPIPNAEEAYSAPVDAPAKPSIEPQVKETAAPSTAPPKSGRKPATWYQSEVILEAIAIADRRGVAVADLAHAIGQPVNNLSFRLRKMGFNFGQRLRLAVAPSLDDILSLRDDATPLPETRREKVKREAASQRRQNRAERHANDPDYRPLGPRPSKPARSTLAAQKRPAPTVSTPARAAPVTVPSRPAVPAGRRLSPIEYAERIAWAKSLLASRFCTVRRANPDDIIPAWAVSGQAGHLSNEELVQLAERMDEGCAR